MVVQRLVGAERCARAIAESRAAAAEGALAAHGLPVPPAAAGAAHWRRRCLTLAPVHRIDACMHIFLHSFHVLRDFGPWHTTPHAKGNTTIACGNCYEEPTSICARCISGADPGAPSTKDLAQRGNVAEAALAPEA